MIRYDSEALLLHKKVFADKILIIKKTHIIVKLIHFSQHFFIFNTKINVENHRHTLFQFSWITNVLCYLNTNVIHQNSIKVIK